MKATKLKKLAAVGIVPLILLATGCLATRNFVRNSQAPQDNRIQSAEEKTAQNTQAIKELGEKTETATAQAQNTGDQAVQAAKQADEHAQAASQTAEQGLAAANQAHSMIKNLQNLEVAHHAVVTFGFNKCNLTPASQTALDQVAEAVGSTKHYLIQIVGHTDSTGAASYNLALSQRRSDSVVRYLSQKHNIPVALIHTAGYGKEIPVASNKTRDGRSQNRRVEVTVLVPQLESQAAQTSPAPSSGN